MKKKWKPMVLALSLAMILGLAVYGTVAFITTQSDSVKNEFNPGIVACTVTVKDGQTSVSVKNTGTVEAMLRVSLVGYMEVEDTGDVGKFVNDTFVPTLTSNSGWEKRSDGYYYRTTALAVGATDTVGSLSNVPSDGKVYATAQALQVGGASWK